ncbi:unnamed protein product [Effrenium voratum]|nr:unnamed protein product [Effrenium voratum]
MQIAVKLPGRTWLWWGSMVAIAFLNLLLFRHVNRSKRARDVEHKRYQRVLKMLCLPFLFECAWRSVFPCLYNERQVLFDTPLNAILLDRSLAAVGEVCWVLQICLILEQLATDLKMHSARPLGKCVVECCSILMALLALCGETCSFLGTFTTNAWYEVLEASCWCLLFALGSLAAASLLCPMSRFRAPACKRFLAVLCLQGFIYCPYMILSNIPMYYQRWQKDEAAHRQYLHLWPGIRDAAQHREPQTEWRYWQNDWLWMSVYFSLAVWSSILMMYAPRIPNDDAVRQHLEIGRST